MRRAAVAWLLSGARWSWGKRYPLDASVLVLVVGVASAHCGPLAVAQAAAGQDQDVLAGHGCRISPRTGLRVAPSASTLDRLPRLLDADELEAALSACVAAAALSPAVPAACAARPQEEQLRLEENKKPRKRKPPAAASFPNERAHSRV